MALMERVATLLRANLNDLLDRAEDPEKLLKQLVLDMQNQLLQVKTQVAMALADEHLLEKKAREQTDAAGSWKGKAELAVSKGEDELARLALERVLSHQDAAAGYLAQRSEQASEVEALRASYNSLHGKLKETEARCEALLAQHRRARARQKANAAAHKPTAGTETDHAMARLRAEVEQVDSRSRADRQISGETNPRALEDRFAVLERDNKVEQLLASLKAGRKLSVEDGDDPARTLSAGG